jgi:hypothetical protein
MTFFFRVAHQILPFSLLSKFLIHLTIIVETMQDMEFTILWVEETLIEATLIFDILFLTFYDNFSPCTLNQWKSLSNLFRVKFLNYSLPTVSSSLELFHLLCFYISRECWADLMVLVE